MKQTLIKITDDHYVIVDDSEIGMEDWYLFNVGYASGIKQADIEDVEGLSYEVSPKKITHSTQPNKGMENVTFISPREVKELIGEVDVEKKVEKFIGCEYDDIEDSIDQIGYDSFIRGYNQALEDSKEKKYTEEDMITAFEKGTNTGALSERFYDYDNGDYEEAPQYYKQQKESFIQSLQPKTEWEVTFDEQGKLRLV